MRRWAYLMLSLISTCGFAQTSGAQETKTPLPVANQGDQVNVKREAARLIDPEKYRVHLYLDPYLTVALSAPFDGIVKQVQFKANSQVKAQSEIVRLENTVQKLSLQKAQADVRAATLEQKLADKKEETQSLLAKAKLDAAQASLDLAQHFHDQTSVRTPISGEVLRVLVTEGQYVRAGEPLAVVGDTTKMKVEIPVERNQVEKDKTHPIKVETAEVQAKVEAVVPLLVKFDPLRDLFQSVASAIVVLDNPDGKYKPGQTVYVPLIPRHAVVEVPSGTVGNLSDGGRKVQVLRQWVVRDLPVVLMGPIGGSRLFVSGAFADGDEVIYETSHQLPDGFQLKPLGATAAATGAGGTTTTPGTTVTRPGGGGF
jgi:multidrug efflux pump subunit AcrA (membrane-fusion protein)